MVGAADRGRLVVGLLIDAGDARDQYAVHVQRLPVAVVGDGEEMVLAVIDAEGRGDHVRQPARGPVHVGVQPTVRADVHVGQRDEDAVDDLAVHDARRRHSLRAEDHAVARRTEPRLERERIVVPTAGRTGEHVVGQADVAAAQIERLADRAGRVGSRSDQRAIGARHAVDGIVLGRPEVRHAGERQAFRRRSRECVPDGKADRVAAVVRVGVAPEDVEDAVRVLRNVRRLADPAVAPVDEQAIDREIRDCRQRVDRTERGDLAADRRTLSECQGVHRDVDAGVADVGRATGGRVRGGAVMHDHADVVALHAGVEMAGGHAELAGEGIVSWSHARGDLAVAPVDVSRVRLDAFRSARIGERGHDRRSGHANRRAEVLRRDDHGRVGDVGDARDCRCRAGEIVGDDGADRVGAGIGIGVTALHGEDAGCCIQDDRPRRGRGAVALGFLIHGTWSE